MSEISFFQELADVFAALGVDIDPKLLKFAVGYWCYNALTQTMPRPTVSSSKGYRWLFDLAHWPAANIGLIFKTSKRLKQGGAQIVPYR